LAYFERPQTRAERCRLRTPERRHAEYLRHGWHAVIHAWLTMRAQNHAHLLQHVAVVIDAGFVEADGDVDAFCFEAVEWCDPAAQAKIRAAIMTDVGPGLGQLVDVVFGEPDPMSERHLWPEQAEASDIVDCSAAAATTRIFLLISGLDKV